ncbi:MAG: Guanosine-5'-triphosphate,3'-diphosphate pyrophosphatase [Alphaproteobacteria bacterium ADurb.Bin438]|nr:MAG: Guanosine-5'-triphosphate,3'-diphosphate pyrophosphatase [Alphaproteobacteria bacterium ADurb.Bin438]
MKYKDFRTKGTYATIDLGTNNCRLLIAKADRNGFRPIEIFSKITKLGEGLAINNCLSIKAMKRTISALSVMAEKLNKRPISQARFVATEACRRAVNGDEFIEKVFEETGMTFEIISPVEEARLAVTGCVPLLNKSSKNVLVFDIGGGSTEVSFAKILDDKRVVLEGMVSVPMGVLTIAEGFLSNELLKSDYNVVVEKVASFLKPFDDEYKISSLVQNKDLQMVGTSGTITTIGAFHLGLSKYKKELIDGMVLSTEDVKKEREKLLLMTKNERLNAKVIGKQRERLILPGCAILDAICRFWHVDKITVADGGLRDGIIMDLMQRTRNKVVYEKRKS